MGKANKSKIDFKQFLINRGEYLAMGIAGFFLLLFLVLGISKWTGTKDSAKIANELNQGASRVHNNIQNGSINPDDEAKTVPPKWVTEGIKYQPIPMGTFALNGPVFDPIAKPETKKQNPVVLPIGTYPGAYQIDLTKAPMQGFDIIYDNEGRTKIAVISGKLVSGADKSKMKSISENLKRKGKQAGEVHTRFVRTQPPGGGLGGGTTPPDGGDAGGPGGFGTGMPPPGMFGSLSMSRGRGGNPYGGMGGGEGYDNTSQRIEKSIEYISIDELDRAIEKGKVPALTVIPLRMVTIHAEIPYKQQLEEIRRALRIPIPPASNEADRKRAEEQALAEAARYAKYDGYEVQRRVTRQVPGAAQPQVIQDWAVYNFEDKYVELIHSRKLADNIEEGYISYFLRYDMALALPLPQLVPEVTESGGYPEIRLKNINETIKKLREANKKPENPSELLARVQGGRRNLYQPVTAGQTGVSELFGDAGTAGLTGLGATGGRGGLGGIAPMPPGGAIRPGGAGGPGGGGGVGGGLDTAGGTTGPGSTPQAPPVEIEHLLLRFVDVDVKPGYTYEYRIRLRMQNPNYRPPEDKGPIEVANPNDAKIKELYSPWLQLAEAITVPAEAFVYAVDVASYRDRIEKEFAKEKELLSRLQVKEGQAVVELATWMEEVRTDSSNKREPVGAWVVADIPVGPGEFIGRKQYVKLPLWSSENKMYILREIPDKVIPPRGGKDVPQPKGWLVDFSTRSVLVDFEGGKVTTKVGGKTITEDVASELLIVRPDGKLIVKSSLQDEDDPNRKKIVSIWTKWVGEVEKRKVESSGSGPGDNFSPRPPGGGGGGPPP
jgi:hypothetical protein